MDSITSVDVSMATTVANESVSTEKKISYGFAGLIFFIAVIVIVIIMRRRCNKNEEVDDDDDDDDDDNDDDRGKYDKSSSAVYEDGDSVFPSDEDDELSEVLVKGKATFHSLKQFPLDETMKVHIRGILIDSRTLDMKRIIGKGQFGCVYEATLAKQIRGSNDYGELTHTKVAVKTVKGNDVNSETIEDFLQEGLIMKDFHHKNVLTLLGVVISNDGMPMIVLPYMVNGNIKKYIETPDLAVTVRDLLGFGLQVAQGMQYLAEQKFVHRDLAARNCMLDEDMVVKVADFGLSRDIYTKDYYASSDKQRKLPVKWMAVECLTKSVFTTKTDVWSFAVFLWELLTRGATPYPDITNWDVCNYVKAGRRMHQPESCPEEVYTMMLQCWDKDPDNRPAFSQLAHDLNLILSASETPTGEDMNHSYANLYLNVDVGGNTPLEGGVLAGGRLSTSDAVEEVEVHS